MPAASMPFATYVRRFSRWPRIHERTVYRSLLEVAERAKIVVQAAVTAAPPASSGGSIGAVATGKYLRAWRTRRMRRANTMGVLISNATKQAWFVEFGRFPSHKRPPLPVIAKWAQVKFGISYREAKRIAWPIANAIKRRGLKARHVLTGDYTKRRLSAHMEEVLTRAVRDAAVKAFGA